MAGRPRQYPSSDKTRWGWKEISGWVDPDTIKPAWVSQIEGPGCSEILAEV
jgi:hypothetical protein